MNIDQPIFLTNGWFVPTHTSLTQSPSPSFLSPDNQPPSSFSPPSYPVTPPDHLGGLTGIGTSAGGCAVYPRGQSCRTVALHVPCPIKTLIAMNPTVCNPNNPSILFTRPVVLCVPQFPAKKK